MQGFMPNKLKSVANRNTHLAPARPVVEHVMIANSSASQNGSSLLESFRSLAAAAPHAAALICGATGELTTRRELLELSGSLAADLRGRGVVAGQSIAVQLPNSPEFVAAFLAARELDVTLVAVDRDARPSELAGIVQHFQINAVAFAPNSDANHHYSPSVVSGSETSDAALRDIALLKLTSGSTGRPKGIRTTEGNLIADCRNICSTMGITPSDRNLGAIPFSHSYGFSNLITPLLMYGTAVVFSNDYLPASLLEICNRFEVTVFPGIPLIFEHLSRLPLEDGSLDGVRTFISAGAPLQATTSRRFFERFGKPIHTFYGCSECGGISYDRVGRGVEHGHAGTAMDGVELSIDPELGRLIVRSEAVAAGYLDHHPDTSLKFAPGRYATDDLVAFEPGGEVRIVGRIGDLINTAGKKVNPREIEATLLEMEGVREAKVYGESAGARGEVVAAAIVASPEVTRESVREFCRLRLSSHKVPRIVKLIEAIPVDERGKFKRSALATL